MPPSALTAAAATFADSSTHGIETLDSLGPTTPILIGSPVSSSLAPSVCSSAPVACPSSSSPPHEAATSDPTRSAAIQPVLLRICPPLSADPLGRVGTWTP